MTKKNYTFDYQVGDIIAIKNRSGFISSGIRLLTSGKYSHTEMILSKAKYDDAFRFTFAANNGLGVHYNSLYRYIKNNISFDVLRIKEGLSNDQKKKLWEGHFKYHGAGYDHRGTIGTLFPFIKDDPTDWFCSELNATQYMNDLGIMAWGEKVDPSEITPVDFCKSDFFEIVHSTD